MTTTGTPTRAISLASGSTLPSGVTLTDNGNGTATLVGTSSVAAGVYDFTIQAANGVSPNATQPFVLTVTSTTTPQPTTLATLLTGSGTFGEDKGLWLVGLITVFDGTSVIDTATLNGTNTSKATGTVTYTVYGVVFTHGFPFVRWGPVASGGTVTVTKGQVPSSNAVTLPVGVYEWQASYSGDTNDLASASQFGSETEIVVPMPECRWGWNWGWNPGCKAQRPN